MVILGVVPPWLSMASKTGSCRSTSAPRRLPAFIRDVRLVDIEGGPHNVGWTHPEELNKAFVDFFAE